MAIMKEYRCFAHGSFDAEGPTCPHGCTTVVEREFRTPIAIKSSRTRNIDATLAALAKEFGYSDLSNASGSVAGGARKPDFRPVWGDVPKGDAFKQGGIIESREGSQGGAVAAASAHRVADPEGASAGFSEIAGMMGPPKPFIDPKLVYGDAKTLADAVHSVT